MESGPHNHTAYVVWTKLHVGTKKLDPLGIRCFLISCFAARPDFSFRSPGQSIVPISTWPSAQRKGRHEMPDPEGSTSIRSIQALVVVFLYHDFETFLAPVAVVNFSLP